MNLHTEYMGIPLKNPIIVGACSLVTDLDKVKKLEEAGAAAIVYKSLFQEQIQLEEYQLHKELTEFKDLHAEMASVFPDIDHAGPEEHLFNIRKTVESVDIPVFASLNALEKKTWLEYALKIEQTGVAGIELNFYATPEKFSSLGSAIEDDQIDVLKEVTKNVKIPISVKLSPYYSAPLHFIHNLSENGAKGLVMFNKLFQPDIDIEKEEHFLPNIIGSEDEYRLALRFSGLLYGKTKASICANSGIKRSDDIIKLILAGADCVQIVSTLYVNSIDYISTLLQEIEAWMTKKGYENLDGFRGKLSKKNIKNPFTYKRAQYIDFIMKSEKLVI